MGFVSGYRIPERCDTLFIWQVVVAQSARGQGLAKRMLQALLNSEACRELHFLETSITRSNEASWALFRSLAKELQAPVEESILFDQNTHFMGKHDTEHLLRIGPFSYQK